MPDEPLMDWEESAFSYDDIMALPDSDPLDFCRENEFRRGYRDGYLAAVDALFDLAWAKSFPRAYDMLRDFADGPLHQWAHGDRTRIEFPPGFAVPCNYCGKPASVLDHVVPRSKGGSSSTSNLVPCCYDCNRSKGNKDLDAWIAIRRQHAK